jgi:hypothetical protein
MKISVTLFFLFAVLVSGFGCTFAQTEFTTDDPAKYSNYIVDIQEEIGNEFIEFSMVLVNSGDFKANDQKRQDVLRKIELALRKLRNMAPFKGTTHLRDESIAVFEFYKKLHAEDYAKLAVLVTQKESGLKELQEYFSLQKEVESQMRTYAARLRNAQERFAKEQRLTLVHNQMQDQFDRILEANIYSREVFLGYIAVARINEAWWEAMQADNFEEMEKQRLAVIEAVKGSSLNSMEGLRGYTTFRDVARERIDWYASLAGNAYKKIHDILANDRRTAEDIEYVNEVIDNYNHQNAEMNDRYNEAARELKTRALPSGQGGN